jgi:hypothetical protein
VIFRSIAFIMHACTICWFAATPSAQRSAQVNVNAIDKANAMKQELLAALEKLGDRLPPNTLDQLVDELGGPDCVAEVRLS